MDFDFLDTELVSSSRRAILSFKTVIEESKPSNEEINQLCGQIHSYPHTTKLDNDFSIAAVDGSGEFPALQQDDIFMHFVTAAGLTYQTYSHRQNKLVLQKEGPSIIKQFILLNDDDDYLKLSYKTFFEDLLGKDLSYCVKESDYCETFSRFGKRIRHHQINWDNLSLSKASQIATHAYLIRSITELAMAIKLLIQEPRYLLLDTSLVYFLLGESPYLPEILKRHLITQANAQNVGVIALCKSHNIPNGNLINRFAKDQLNLKDHWYLRLPSEELGENTPLFLQGKEIPPKLCVSYLFKFEATSFPMRIDVDAEWWKTNINQDNEKEQQFFSDLDFTCHEVRSYGYPYPMHAAHRRASLTKKERKLIHDLLLQNAKKEGLGPTGFGLDPEQLHMSGM